MRLDNVSIILLTCSIAHDNQLVIYFNRSIENRGGQIE